LISIRARLAVAGLSLGLLLSGGAASAATKAYAAQMRCLIDPPEAREGQVQACSDLIAIPGQSKLRYAQAHTFRGLARFTTGDAPGALADTDQAIALDATYFMPYSLRGRIYYSRREYDRAIAELDTALRLRPEFAFALWWRGQAYAGKGDYDRAIVDYDAAIQRLPGLQTYFSRGYAYLRKGDLKKADDDFARAGEQTTNGKILSQLARSFAELDLYDRAMSTFARAVGAEPKRADTWNERCWARAVAGRELTEALADCDRALVLTPADPTFLDSRGLVRFRSGDYAGAVADLDAALRAKQTAGGLFVRGVARKKLGQAAGDGDISLALVLDPKVAELYATRGVRP
jgi:tetratricopeptide (TPR) repeat protein